jgi:oxygen-independent coproporphyrinogen-3 oxidase
MLHKNIYYHGEEITSVYFGGGTPSLLPVWFVAALLTEIRKEFNLIHNAEISIEVNPKTISVAKAQMLKQAGVNRISIGVQSLIDADLVMLGRTHNSQQAVECVYLAASVFDNISIDMIYNRPGQLLSDWLVELRKALVLPISHASLYELIIEDGTKLQRAIATKNLSLPSLTEPFIEKTIELAEDLGLEMYEISNFAKSAKYRCKHNIAYWSYNNYYGIGPGAHSRTTRNGRKIAIAQLCDINEWLRWSEHPAFVEETLSTDDELKELLIMGLRTKFGIPLRSIPQSLMNKYELKNKLEKLQKSEYIVIDGDCVVLTYSGVLRINSVIQYLVS